MGDTVRDDAAADCLIGRAGADWIFASAIDAIYAAADDQIERI